MVAVGTDAGVTVGALLAAAPVGAAVDEGGSVLAAAPVGGTVDAEGEAVGMLLAEGEAVGMLLAAAPVGGAVAQPNGSSVSLHRKRGRAEPVPPPAAAATSAIIARPTARATDRHGIATVAASGASAAAPGTSIVWSGGIGRAFGTTLSSYW